MSRLPRGPSATAPTGTPGGSLRPPNSGLTLPRTMVGSNLHADVHTTPALTQRMQQTGSRRATLTTSTFMPLPTDGSATVSRSSGIGGTPATRLLGIAPASLVPPSDSYGTLGTRATGLRGTTRLGPLSRIHARSPTAEPLVSHGPNGEDISRDDSPKLESDRHVHQIAEAPSASHQGQNVAPIANASSLIQGSAGNGDPSPRPGSIAGLRCGESVLIPTQGLRGTLRYLGPIDGKQGAWAGIELDETGKGKNDGSVAGKAYFLCPPNSGLFLAPSKVQPIPQVQKAASPTQAPHLFTALETQRDQKTQSSRSRIGSEAHSTIGMSRTPSNRSITSPMLGRRKTLSRVAPSAAQTPMPEVPSGSSRTRLPPATMSRGASRTRPISTTGSVASNRTASPLLSRPSSRLLAPGSSTEPSTHLLSPSKNPPATLQRTTTLGNTQTAEQRLPRRNPGMPRPIAASSGSQAEQANRKGTGAALRSRTGAPADSVERLRLRVDMVEAENRMLRLKSEQDKAHLAAGQMLARDLAIVNGSTSSPTHNLGSSSGPSDSDVSLVEQQLKVARDTLERERAAAKETIANLENEIRGLKTSSTGEGSPSSNGTKQGAYMDISDVSVAFNSLPDSNKLESKILELQSMLDHAKESHVQDTLASENAYSQLRQTLEDKNSTIASMKAQISGKGEETSALKLRIEAITAELDSTTRLYQDMLKAEDVGSGANEGSSNPAIESALSEQVDRLHTEVASAKSAKAELVTGKQPLSATGDDLSRSQGLLKDAQSMPLDYENLHGLAVEYHVYMHRLARLIGERGGEHGDSVRLALDGMPVEFDKSKVSLEAISQLFSRAIICLNQLLDNADSATKQIEAAADEIRSKDTHISALDMEILDLKRQLAQSPSETLADFDDHDSAPQQYQYLQSRIEELENMNEELSLHRDGLIRERAQFNEQFNMLEAESNRLVEDIDRLTAQNKKLSEDLRVTSLQNSTVSLDMASLESKLSGEPPAASLSAMSVEWNADTDNNTTAAIDDLRRKYELEISALKSSLVEMELRKNREIKKLEDDVATAEMVAEDKVFNEYDLNRKIVELTDEVDRLQRKNQRSSSSEPAANGVPTTQTDGDHATFNGSNIAKSPPPASDSFQFSGVSASSAVHEARNSVVGLIDDESMYCDICDSPGHVFSDCPQMTAPSNIFKQRVSIDSSRPYCDNCEEFGEHWTEDCPHGDEMF